MPHNILYIHSHDTGRYIQPYGHAVPTPNLQALAQEGVLFRQAFCGGPTCSASRAALLTGMYAHSSGMAGLAHRGFALSDYDRHLVRFLGRNGYRTALAGIQHEAADDETIGYHEILGGGSRGERRREPHLAAAEFLERRPDGPFFLSVGFFETHRVFPEPGPEDNPAYCRPPTPLPDAPETRYDMAAFTTSARSLDANMGAVLDALERSRLAGDTLVICTTDHGPAFPRMKCNLTDAGTGVMLIVRGPGGFTGGRACDALVSHVDVFPTLCELTGLQPPPWLQGRSLLPLVRGEADEVRDAVFSEVSYHAAYEPMRCARTRRWKYIRRFGPRRTVVLPNCDDGPSKNLWLEHGWAESRYADEELYDLVFDPNESANLAEQPAMLPVLEEMRARLGRWMRETDDPLLAGYVAAPPGARLNDPDGLSPNEEPMLAAEAPAGWQGTPADAGTL